MSRDALLATYGASQWVIEANLADISHAESLIRSESGGNCLNWVTGHILASRDGVLGLLGEEPFLGQDRGAPYQRGAGGLGENEAPLDLEELRSGLARTGKKIQFRLARLTNEQLAEPVDPSLIPLKVENPTRGTFLALLLFHEAYHAGQLGMGRHQAGKSGVIQ